MLIERGRTVEPNGCHSFNGKRGKYPTVGGKGHKVIIIRHLLGLTLGDGQEARHTCDNNWCINREHLVVGTSDDNTDDMVKRDRSARGEKHWNWKGGDSRNYREGRNLRAGRPRRAP